MLSRRHACLVVAFLLAAPLAALCDPADDFLRAEMARQRIPGLSLIVLRNGEVIKAAGYGLADRKQKIAATPDTVYKIASGSKQFIATGIMLLVQEGRIGLGDPLTRFLEGTPAAWSGITIRHLLTHTAGLVREAPGFDPFKVQSDADVLRSAYALPLRFPPGQKWEYSNTGYFALAEIIRKVSGLPWGDYLADKVFKPLGMQATRTTPTSATEKIARYAQGYVDNDTLRDAPRWLALRPSGAFLSTVRDLGRWDAALRTESILTASTRQQMWTPVTLNDGATYPYGFGWMMANVRGHRLIHHPGGMPGFRSDIARFVDDDLTIIVLMNLDDVDIDAVIDGLAAAYLTRAPQ
jgi:CubicO group peptidase (beta-lactamase class C family)